MDGEEERRRHLSFLGNEAIDEEEEQQQESVLKTQNMNVDRCVKLYEKAPKMLNCSPAKFRVMLPIIIYLRTQQYLPQQMHNLIFI